MIFCVRQKYLGFSETVISWFRSYLSLRSHHVFVCASEKYYWAYLETGDPPQGSVLGTLLFLIYLFIWSYLKFDRVAHMIYMQMILSCSFTTYLNMLVCGIIRIIDWIKEIKSGYYFFCTVNLLLLMIASPVMSSNSYFVTLLYLSWPWIFYTVIMIYKISVSTTSNTCLSQHFFKLSRRVSQQIYLTILSNALM